MGGFIGSLVYLAIIVALLASFWKVFEKAGEPGWAALIPIYNLFVMLKISGKPGWWVVLMLIPLVNIIVAIIATLALAKKFGQSGGFAVGMILLPFVFYPMLAFGDARYTA
jgi:hypothetical protein